MSFNNIWFLFLLVPLITLFIIEIYIDKRDHIFPNAAIKIRKQNYIRVNYNKHRLKYILFMAIIIGTPAALAWSIASRVCGLTSSSAATIIITISVT